MSQTDQVSKQSSHHIEIFDTTLRDGAQFEGISLSVDDKLKIAARLDTLGVHYIEGGWPGANPKDEAFFARAASGELPLTASTLVAFGSTRKPNSDAATDPTIKNLLAAQTSTVCIVAKAWDYHVTEALRTTLQEAIAMVSDSVAYLVSQNKRVVVDFEHFFDGYKHNPDFAFAVLQAAADQKAETLVLCDTNGGSLPHEVEEITTKVVAEFPDLIVGMHTQNDTGCAVANALAGVRAGARHVQGTINGYGERTGNCDLTTLISNLSLKMGVPTIGSEKIATLKAASEFVAEVVNLPTMPQQPYVGTSAFAHKAGLHTSAIARRPDAYEHVAPASVGNRTRFLVSDLSGKSTLALKAQEFGLELADNELRDVLAQLKNLENLGYQFEAAEASLFLLMKRAQGFDHDLFRIESYRVISEHRIAQHSQPNADAIDQTLTEATLKIFFGDERVIATGEGNGPVHALDAAFRKAATSRLPLVETIRLTDYKVRIIDSASGTGAITRVLLDASDGTKQWTTIGVSHNIIEASWQALEDAIAYAALR